jgi:serine/threonine protein kinase
VQGSTPFGKYLLLERISVGGMAEVFKAKSFGVEGFEKVVAIKRILPSMAEDAEFIEMFIDEAKIAGQLSHANICQIFELGEIEGSHFISMEYISGKDVLQIGNRFRKLRQRMPPPMVAFIIAKVCEGLDYAHRKRDASGRALQIIHRDVSPQNVLVSYEGEVKIIDFGIAKAAVRSGRTQAGVLKGKFGYMSPEQVRGLPLDRRTDLFAIGTLLWETLSGERLFSHDSDFSTLEKVRNAEVPSLSAKVPGLAPELEQIVMKALAREVDDRYQWANEIQEDLQRFLNKQDPTFTAKQLADWMKDAFDTELTREKQLLDEYKKITGITPAPQFPPSPPPPPVRRSQPIAAAAPMPVPSESTSGEIELIDATEVEPARMRPSVMGMGQLGDEAPTELYGDGGLGRAMGTPPISSSVRRTATAQPPPPPGSPQRLEMAPTGGAPRGFAERGAERSGAPSEMQGIPPGAVTAPLRSSGSRPNPLAHPTQPLPAPPADARTPLSPGPPSQPASRPSGNLAVPAGPRPGSTGPRPGVSAQTLSVRAIPGRSTLVRDIALGALAAVAVAGMIAGTYYLGTRVFSQPSPKPGPSAGGSTLVVATADGAEGDVFLNGTSKGSVARGEPVTIDGLPPGEYEVVVRRSGAPDCVNKVVMAQAAQVVTCRFPAAEDPGKLILSVVTEGATVLVDDQEISPDAAREPLILTPRAKHTIKVTKEGFAPETFEITLAPGEVKQRVVDLLPAEKSEGKRPDRPSRPSDPPDDPAEDEIMSPPSARPEGKDGYLVANTTPWARVFIDGKDTGKMTPIASRARIPLSPGRHVVTFVVGDQRFDYTVFIKAGEDVRLMKQLPIE